MVEAPHPARRKTFRIVGHLEAYSFLLLVGVAMPLKYFWGMPWATQFPGMIHGVLFMAYIYLALDLAREEKWTKKRLFLAFLASVLPVGTIIFDWKVMRADELK